MQNAHTVRPHDPAACDACAPRGPGHPGCQADGCSEPGEARQVRRHATAAEYAQLPAGLVPIDGICHLAVHACDDHAEDIPLSICRHPEPAPAPCPKCKAAGDQPCTAKNGDPRYAPHTARAQAQPPPAACTHAHREDCPIFTGCRCTGEDPDPARPKRTALPATADTSATRMSPVQLAIWAQQHGVNLDLLAGPARTCRTQDNRPAIALPLHVPDADGNLARDAHGHLVVAERVIPVDPAPGGPTAILARR